MSEQPHAREAWHQADYEGFEIHVCPVPKDGEKTAPGVAATPARYTYDGYVCHPGADPALPGHTVPFHADGEESFASADDALHEGLHVGRSIVEGTHPDLSVLGLVTSGV
jgi:hypothetical protein